MANFSESIPLKENEGFSEVYRNATYPVMGWLVIVICAGVFVARGFEVKPRWTIVILGLLMGLPAWLCVRFYIHARVEADQSGVTIINAFRTHFVAWSAIEKVSADTRLDVQLANGTHLRAFAVQAANGARIFGMRSSADNVAEALNKHLVASRGASWLQEKAQFEVSESQKKSIRTEALIFAVVILIGLIARLIA